MFHLIDVVYVYIRIDYFCECSFELDRIFHLYCLLSGKFLFDLAVQSGAVPRGKYWQWGMVMVVW